MIGRILSGRLKLQRRSDWLKVESADFPTNPSLNPHWPPETTRRQVPLTRTFPRPSPSLTTHQLVRPLTLATPTIHRHPYQALRHTLASTTPPPPSHQNSRVFRRRWEKSRAGQKLEVKRQTQVCSPITQPDVRGQPSASLIV